MTCEFDGEKYRQASRHQREWGMALIAELGLEGTERILDLGCGDGTLSANLADLVPRGEVIAIDASAGMLEAAQTQRRPNLHFRRLDINDLDFTEEFDVVFSNAALHWVKDHQQTLQKVKTSLRESGRLRFSFAGKGNCANFIRVIREAMVLEAFSPYFSQFEWPWQMPDVATYEDLARQSGLCDIRVWEENADRDFTDAAAMILWIEQPGLVPFLSVVAAKDRPAFRNFVVERMIEETEQPDGCCRETFRRINLLARK